MSRITGCFAALKEAQRTALVPFVTAGDPNPAVTVPLMHAMVAAGANIIELGVPFSDPMADGPVIQRATERALEHNVSLRDVMAMVSEFRQTDNDTPVVLMGYLNPIEVMGYETFAAAAAEAGVDGVLTVDIPPEESEDFGPAMKAQGLDCIFLLAPTSGGARIDSICSAASGFVYYVSLKGVTGAANLDVEGVTTKLAEIRTHSDLPLGVGFGIKDATTAGRMAKIADAVIVGSVLVKQIEANPTDVSGFQSAITSILSDMRAVMDSKN